MHQNFQYSEPGTEAAWVCKTGKSLEQDQLRTIFDASAIGMAQLDLQGHPQISNPALQHMLRYSQAELSVKSIVELCHPDDGNTFRTRFHQLIQGKRDRHQVQQRFIRKGGKVVWGGLTATLVRDPSGQPQNIVCLVEDITKSIHLQRSIRNAAAFAEFNPNPVFEFSPEGDLCYCNKAAKDLALSVGRDDPSGVLPQETQEIVSQCWHTGKSRLRLTTQLEQRTLSWSFFPIASIGKVHCYAGDITEKLALEDQLRQSQKLEAIGQLAAGVAHDFNNILTVIQGNAAMFSTAQHTSPEANECAEQIVYAADRAASLTRQLLVFSRKQILRPSNLDLNEVVENMVRMLHRLLGEHIALRTELTAKLPFIYADNGMLEQVILNLSVNSRDAMPQGGQLLIKTRLETMEQKAGSRAGDFVCLSVHDTGCGIPSENLGRIFEPFFTTKEIGKGTGLGLPTVYGIVHQHQGWINVASQLGQGTTFEIYLPAMKNPKTEPIVPPAAPEMPSGSETILVVEDEGHLRELISSILQRCGYKILIAASGVAALEVWKEHKDEIDLLFTDMIMPDGLTGRELAAKLKEERKNLKIIYSSGYSSDMVEGVDQPELEGVVFLQKPYNPASLAQIVRDCLHKNN